MKRPVRYALFVFVFAVILLAACAPMAMPTSAPPEAFIDSEEPMVMSTQSALFRTDGDEMSAGGAGGESQKAAPADAPDSLEGVVDAKTNNATLPDIPPQESGHMIIKNADVKLQVEDTDTAIDRTTQIVGDVGGYIISSRVWYQDYSGSNYKYATITIGVPVDQFENAMRRLRTLALRVLDENASGQDVTSEFVDLQSQLGNLEATRDRIRSFLEDAKTVDESLRINQELSDIEDQIEQVKGRMNYLSGRSSYSTITINLEPKLPTLTPTPTPTMTPTRTPRPTSTPTVWNPGKTFNAATNTITNAYQGIIEALIWFLIVVVPLLAPPIFILWAIWKFIIRKGSKPASGS